MVDTHAARTKTLTNTQGLMNCNDEIISSPAISLTANKKEVDKQILLSIIRTYMV